MRATSDTLVPELSIFPVSSELTLVLTFNPPAISPADEHRRLMEALMIEKPRTPKTQLTMPRPANPPLDKGTTSTSSMAQLVDAFSNQPSTVVLSTKECE